MRKEIAEEHLDQLPVVTLSVAGIPIEIHAHHDKREVTVRFVADAKSAENGGAIFKNAGLALDYYLRFGSNPNIQANIRRIITLINMFAEKGAMKQFPGVAIVAPSYLEHAGIVESTIRVGEANFDVVYDFIYQKLHTCPDFHLLTAPDGHGHRI